MRRSKKKWVEVRNGEKQKGRKGRVGRRNSGKESGRAGKSKEVGAGVRKE